MGGGGTQKARRPNSHRRAANAQPTAHQPAFTVPSNPPLAPAPIRPQPQRPQPPKSSTWGPPLPSPTNPAASFPKARPSVSPQQQFKGAAGGNAFSPAQRKPLRKEGAHSNAFLKQSPFVPQQPPSSSAATGWTPHGWGRTDGHQRNDAVSPPATSATFAVASGDSKLGLGSSGQAARAADSAGSQPPVFAAGASSAAAAARPNRATGHYAVRNHMTVMDSIRTVLRLPSGTCNSFRLFDNHSCAELWYSTVALSLSKRFALPLLSNIALGNLHCICS